METQLTEVLRGGRQCDEDGTEIIMSRQACHEAADQIVRLRSALAGLIGADTETELQQMEVAIRMLPAPDTDKAVSINAIHALLATMTPNV